MGKLLLTVLVAILTSCGGGSHDTSLSPVVDTSNQGIVTEYNDLTAVLGTPVSTTLATLCGYDVGANLIEGTVTNVHDGDTITVNGYNIRLDSIDAPELAQTYGAQSQENLARLVMGQPVKVAYTKYDKYGRIVGAVFTNTCQYANLAQLISGSAWFYRAYQCEISGFDRDLFNKSEFIAKADRVGLWAETNPTPPWVYRNGVEAKIPTCTTVKPVWAGNPSTENVPTITSKTSTTTITTATTINSSTGSTIYTPPNTGCYIVYVNGYYRQDGTYVKPYTRNSPGCG